MANRTPARDSLPNRFKLGMIPTATDFRNFIEAATDASELVVGTLDNARLAETVEANYFQGNGAALTHLNASMLTSGMIPSERCDYAVQQDIRDANGRKILNAEHGNWLNNKLEALSCPVLLDIKVRCVELDAEIDVTAPPGQIDGVAIKDGDLVLLTAQSDATENRIWQVKQTGSDTELVALENAPTLTTGHALSIGEGQANRDKVFVLAAQYGADEAMAYYWQSTASITLAGAGLTANQNRVSADLASTQDVTQKVAAKLVDAKLLSQQLTKVKTTITNAYTSKDASLKTELTEDFVARDATLKADLSLDFTAQIETQSTALSADYSAQVAEQKARIDSILMASEADKDSFAEIVALINSVDTESDAAFAGYVQTNNARSSKIEADLAGEITTRGVAVEALRSDLQDEIAARNSAVDGLRSDLQAEANTRSQALNHLQTEVTALSTGSTNRYTKTESDARYTLKTGDTLSGAFTIHAANFVGDLHVNGAITASKDITAFSDARLKTQVREIDHALDRITQLQGVTFERSDLADGRRYSGLIAQQVQQVLPEVVHQEGEYLSVAYGNMVGLLVESIKALNDKVNHLQNRLADLDT